MPITNEENDEMDAGRIIYDDFAHTPYGKLLSVRARYDRFRPHTYDVKYWERLMGHDVNNLHHMRQTVRLGLWFLKQEDLAHQNNFSKNEKMLLIVTAALHDQAEAIIGDIPHGRKTNAERKNEENILKIHESVFAPRIKGPLLKLYRTGRDSIAFNESTSKLPSAFRVIELIGFTKNAITALKRLDELEKHPLPTHQAKYLNIKTKQEQDLLIVRLNRLFADVFSCGVFSQLINLGVHFPTAHIFLRQSTTKINHGFNLIEESIFDWYSNGEDSTAAPDEKQRKVEALKSEKKLWEEWIKNGN